MSAWTWLLIAGVLEVAWAIGLKYTDGWTRLWPSIATLALLATSMYCLAVAARTLPIGTAYAVWTGIGAAGTAVLGMLLLGEPRTAWRLTSLALILLGVAGLKLAR
jgi:quaternary ammonium compound-resistance protein SugE